MPNNKIVTSKCAFCNQEVELNEKEIFRKRFSCPKCNKKSHILIKSKREKRTEELVEISFKSKPHIVNKNAIGKPAQKSKKNDNRIALKGDGSESDCPSCSGRGGLLIDSSLGVGQSITQRQICRLCNGSGKVNDNAKKEYQSIMFQGMVKLMEEENSFSFKFQKVMKVLFCGIIVAILATVVSLIAMPVFYAVFPSIFGEFSENQIFVAVFFWTVFAEVAVLRT